MRRRAGLGLTAGLLLLAGLGGSTVPLPPSGFLGAFDWSMESPRFGGLSALEISADGSGLVVLTDRGHIARAVIRRDAQGRIADIATQPFTQLRDGDGVRLPPGRTDSEGLAVTANGQIYVSFEGPARVQHYASLDSAAENLPQAQGFAKMDKNKALEALAISEDGTLYTLPEDTPAPAQDFPLYRLRDGQWDSAIRITRLGNFLPVGADVGPDGRLYVLERQFRGLAGFVSRLRRFDLDAGRQSGVILLETSAGVHDNLEGVTIWRDAAGHLTASMVSDNNFLGFLATEIVEYRLPD